jgi:group I intron endonuclease
MIAHQYKIREEKEEKEINDIPFELSKVCLKNTLVKQISKKEATEIVLEYEWLKKMPAFSMYYFGIFFIIDEKEYLGGVLVYSPEYSLNTGVWDKFGFSDKILLLSRGVCLWWTPKNTASFFITKANNWIKNNTKYRIITATVDPMAGEIGTIYQSLNWYYVGLMSGNYSNGKELKRMTIIIDGKQYTSRHIRKKYGTMKKDEILKIHPNAVYVPQYRKRRYFCFIGGKKENKWYYNSIKNILLPYPKRNEKDIKGIIYKITNTLNNKVYIGQTVRGFLERYNEYKSDFKNKSKSNNIYLYNSFLKYGFDNFKFEIIDHAESIEELNEKEIHYIKKYNTTDRNFGYNLHDGGRNSLLSEETKKKMSESRKGKPKPDGWREKTIPPAGSEEAKKYGRPKTEEQKKYLSENSPKYWLGKKRDPDTVKKMSETKKKMNIKPSNSKKIVMVDNDNNYKIYESARDCSKDTNYSYDQIYDRLRGKLRNNLPHKFYYLDDYKFIKN